MEAQSGWWNLKELIKSREFCINTKCLPLFVQKLHAPKRFVYPLFLYCGRDFCQGAYKNYRKTQPLMIHNSRATEDRHTM